MDASRANLSLGAVAAGLCSHAVFNRFEPNVKTVPTLLLLGVSATVAWLNLVASLGWTEALVASLKLLGIYVATLLSSITAYRLSPVHKLAKVPGPFLCKITQAVWFKQNLGMHARFWIERQHEIYGPIVRIGPNHLSFASADAVQYAHGFKGAWERSPSYLHGIMAGKNPEDAALGRLRPRAAHRERRRAFEPAFVSTSLQNYEPIIYRCASRLMSLFDRRQGQVIDLAEHVRYFTWEFMSLVVFSDPQDTLDIGKDSTNMIDDTVEVARWGLKFDALPWFRDILFLILPLPDKLKQVGKYADDAYRKRLRDGPNQHVTRDLFSYIEDDKHGLKLTEAQMSSDSFGLVFGAVDTTAQAYSLTLMYILDRPGCFEKLRAELEARFENDVVTIEGTRDLPFLEACISESLRLISPIPSGVSRECPTDQMVDGWLIPAKTTVRFPTFVIQRDPANFSPDPKAFRPERWIDPSKETAFNIGAYYPFNIGHHACIGKSLALQELRYGIACVVLQFNMRLAPGFDVDKFMRDSMLDMFFASFVDPIPVIMERRTDKTFAISEDH